MKSVTRTDCSRSGADADDDTFLGVRLLSAKSVRAIFHASVCLVDAVRSQGFSPSQRFVPAWTLWPCFVPHPPIGFWPSELFPLGQPWHLTMPCTLLPLDWPTNIPGEPVLLANPCPFVQRNSRSSCRAETALSPVLPASCILHQLIRSHRRSEREQHSERQEQPARR